MAKFEALALGEFLNKRGIEITIRSFADFYHSLTPKHQKSVQLNYVGCYQEDFAYLQETIKLNEIASKVRVYRRVLEDELEDIYKRSSILIYPSSESAGKVIPDILSFGLPILCFNCDGMQDFIDLTCGMPIDYQTQEQSIEEFSKMLNILYHDPEVRKILRKGAFNRYDNYFSWGLKGRRSMAS